MDFRQATGKLIQWLDTGIQQGFSNFLFVDQNYGSNPVLRRIFSIARQHQYQSVLIEQIEESGCALMAAENQMLALRHPDFERSEVHRITFFRSPTTTPPTTDDFVGYVIFKRDIFTGQAQPRVHVYESVLPPFRKSAQNNFVHSYRRYEVMTVFGKFPVMGVLYAQQNDLTFVCAHVAMRTALASLLPERDITYAMINSLANVDHKTRKVGGPAGGLSPAEMEKVLTGMGLQFDKVVHEPTQQLNLPTEYQRDLYGAIESGFPALVGFELDDPTALPGNSAPRHIIPVFGHTFNEDTWMPQAQRAYFGGKQSYFPSENWLSTYVVHDDNFGPYLCLPRHFLKKDNFRLIYGIKPHATAFNAVQAEAIGYSFCNAIARARPRTGSDWYDRFSVFTLQGWLVLRTLLVGKAAYMEHLKNMATWNGVSMEPELHKKFQDHLPERFWMIETSAPELFNSSRRKFGEILLQSDKQLPQSQAVDATYLLAARLPGLVYFRPGQQQIEVWPTALDGHSPLYSITPSC